MPSYDIHIDYTARKLLKTIAGCLSKYNHGVNQMKAIKMHGRGQGKSCAQLIDLAWSERSREQIVELLTMAIKGIFVSTDKKDRDIMIIIDYDDADDTATPITRYFVDDTATPITRYFVDECEFKVDQITKQKHPPRSFSNRGKGKRKQW